MEDPKNFNLLDLSDQIVRLSPKRDSDIEERVNAVEDNIIMLEITVEYLIDRLTRSINEIFESVNSEEEVDENE